MKKTAKNVELPRTVAGLIASKRKEANEISMQIHELAKKFEDIRRSEFEATGGCDRCGGRGWIVTWDTLDSLSGCYAEYGKCPNEQCTEETRAKSGLAPYHSKYDTNQGVKYWLHAMPGWNVVAGPFYELLKSINAEIKELEDSNVLDRGTTVVIARGRKAPVGFVGKIFWMKQYEYGVRTGVKNDKEEVQWTYLSNLEKVA